jgi:23S rRNA (cytosine1962-C5)-methyltransferase
MVEKRAKTGASVSVLNLFAYTGGVSCVLAKAGATVTHVDASKQSIMWAQANKKINDLKEKSITCMIDDVVKFVEREIRRGNTYDMILLDPPVYGKGAKKEAWHLEKDLVPLLVKVSKLLSKKPLCVHLSGYASVYTHETYKNILGDVFTSAQLESGELCIKESSTERLLTAGIYSTALFI